MEFYIKFLKYAKQRLYCLQIYIKSLIKGKEVINMLRKPQVQKRRHLGEGPKSAN